MSYGQRPSSAGRGRASRRTYMVRRLVAALIVVGFLWVAVSAIGSVFGGDDSDARVVGAPPSTNTVVVDPGGTTTLQPTTTTEPPVKEPTVPSAADPAELLIIGDSDAGTFGPYLKSRHDGQMSGGREEFRAISPMSVLLSHLNIASPLARA